jgi:hypothetical protein
MTVLLGISGLQKTHETGIPAGLEDLAEFYIVAFWFCRQNPAALWSFQQAFEFSSVTNANIKF